MYKNFHKNKYNRGVTLIELLVVISIFMVISSITVFSYGKFNSSLSLQNLADDIALSVRRAQGYAIGVRGLGGTFGQGYGVRFTANTSTSDLPAGSIKSFILFIDISGDRIYSRTPSSNCPTVPTVANECLEVLSIKSADRISEIYYNDTNLITPNSTIDLLFKRPNPEPTFCYRPGGAGSCSGISIYNVSIKISTDADPNTYKWITISNNGQISTNN